MAVGSKTLRISAHAVERYIQRVQTLQPPAAITAMHRFLRTGRVRPTPRHWTRAIVQPSPGLKFVYSALAPGVCFLVREETVVTVVTRDLARRARGHKVHEPCRRPRRSRPHHSRRERLAVRAVARRYPRRPE